MPHFEGQIIHAQVDPMSHESTITSFKHVQAGSVWRSDQTIQMVAELEKAIARNDENFVVTIRDSLPILLNKEEMAALQNDLHNMQSLID